MTKITQSFFEQLKYEFRQTTKDGLYVWWIVAVANICGLFVVFIYDMDLFFDPADFIFILVIFYSLSFFPVIFSRFGKGKYLFFVTLLVFVFLIFNSTHIPDTGIYYGLLVFSFFYFLGRSAKKYEIKTVALLALGGLIVALVLLSLLLFWK